MPKITANGISLAYEIYGDGPPVVWTSGGRSPGIKQEVSIAYFGRLTEKYRVLIYDRRNCGASDVLFEDAPSDSEQWADDLHCLGSA